MTKLWTEVEALFEDHPPGQYSVYSAVAGYTTARRTRMVNVPAMDDFVEHEDLQGLLDNVEIDYILATGNPDDPSRVRRAVHLEIDAFGQNLLSLRGEKAWTDRAEKVILQFFSRRRSRSVWKRVLAGLAAGVLLFMVIASGPIFLNFAPSSTEIWEFGIGVSLLTGLVFGWSIYTVSENWFPASKVYADAASADPKWWNRWIEAIVVSIVGGLFVAWILAALAAVGK